MFKKDNYDLIEKMFLDNPNLGFRITELSKLLNLAPKSLYNYLKYFQEIKLIKLKEEYGIKLYFANKESNHYKNSKIIYNLKQLENSKIIDEINLKFDYPPIILFGSKAKGEDDEKSDFDIAIVSSINAKMNLQNYEKKLNAKIQILKIKDFNSLSVELKNNLINGKIISGYLEVFK